MSTRTSSDLNITRPSTRLHAPPGGNSSITFGTTPQKTAQIAAATNSSSSNALVPNTSAAILEQITVKHAFKVVIISAIPTSAEAITPILVKALSKVGLVHVSITETEDAMNMPYIAQALAASCDGVIAAGIVTTEIGAVAQTITASLLQVGISGQMPIVPAVLEAKSLLEAKVLMSDKADTWANSLLSLMSIKANKKNMVVTAAPALTSPVYKPLEAAKQTSADGLLLVLRESFKKRGANGIFGIGRKFRIMDDDDSKSISLSEFKKAIGEHTLGWTDAQIKQIFDFFDRDKSGSISYDEFLRGVRDPINDRRKQFVYMAFQIMDVDKNGTIDHEDIKGRYNASKHPEVIAGKMSEADVLRGFLDTFDGVVKDGKVTPDEFLEYYSDVSASIDDDDYFELMMRNAWHISGGEGWCANTSNRRVLVTHNDGRQTVEEIKDDIGIGSTDFAAMLENLKNQGISDAKAISTNGAVEVAASALEGTPRPTASSSTPSSTPQRLAGHPQSALNSRITFG